MECGSRRGHRCDANVDVGETEAIMWSYSL